MSTPRIAQAARISAAVAFIAVSALVSACSSSTHSTSTPATPSGGSGTQSIAVAPSTASAAVTGGLYGDPVAAAKYWRAQSLEDNCGLMSVADVVGEITGQLPTEEQVLTLAEHTPSAVNSGDPIYAPRADASHSNGNGGISRGDLGVLLDHYGIKSAMNEKGHPDQTGMPVLEQYLAGGRKVIAFVNSAVIWNTSDQRTDPDHFLVVTGIDTNKEIVHLNDPGADHADEQVSFTAFTTAWQTSDDRMTYTVPSG